ncbi:MAG: glycosyltransferase [Candidatus Levybacteria bacterium]|nr:glycosyltransferase [Candidatus Levybacteria bacterium]
MKEKPYLSIIVPIYNESNRLDNLSTIASYLKKLKVKTELIVVNDGSNDSTKNILDDLRKKLKFKIISYKENKGKGYAVKIGMLKAQGKLRLFTDIDLSVPIEECSKLMKFAEFNQVVIGSRRVAKSKIILHQPIIRELMGRFFTFLSQKTLSLEISDFTCGFKMFREKAAGKIFQKSRINRWGFDSEILFIANKLEHKIYEAPISWSHNINTKVKFPEDIIRSLIDLILIRFNSLRGIYR